MRQPLFLVFVGMLLLPASVLAQSPAATEVSAQVVESTGLKLPSSANLLTLVSNYNRYSDNTETQAPLPPMIDHDPRRTVLSSLHAITGVVQTYDGMLTLRVLHAGGIETNPLIKPVASSEKAMIAVKVAAAVATVMGAESLWRNNHKLGAILASVAANSAMAMVAHHNAGVLRRLEGR